MCTYAINFNRIGYIYLLACVKIDARQCEEKDAQRMRVSVAPERFTPVVRQQALRTLRKRKRMLVKQKGGFF